jgi:putative MATE family efflux protein
MRNRNACDLTEGGILRGLLWVATPIMGASLMQMAYNLTDMFWLGRSVGSQAVAASGTAGAYLWLSMALVLIGRLGAEIGVSQSLGAKDRDGALDYARGALLLAAALGLAYGLAMTLCSGPLIAVFHFRPEEAALESSAAEYLAIVGVGVPFFCVSAAVNGVFNGAGNARLSFRANAVGLVVNIALDPLLIVTAGWGVAGAAIATVLAQVVVCALFLLFLKRHRESPFPAFKLFALPARAATLRRIARWSLPACLESGLFTLLAMVTTRLIASFGGDAVAVQRVGSQVESLSWLVGGGFGTAVTAFVGQNYGAGKWPRIRRGFRISMAAMLGYGAAITALMYFEGRLLYAAFVREQSIRDMGGVYLRIFAVCQLFACVESVAAGAFRGLGKTVPPAVVSIACNILRVPLAYRLAATPLGLDGVWWAISLVAVLRGTLIYAWYALAARRQPRLPEGARSAHPLGDDPRHLDAGDRGLHQPPGDARAIADGEQAGDAGLEARVDHHL